MSDKHPDLMALAEGRLSPEESRQAQAHLETCVACRGRAGELRQALAGIDGPVQRVMAVFSDPAHLAAETDTWMGALDLEQPAELVLSQDEVVERLPSELRRKVAGLRQDSLGARLKRSVEKLTGLGPAPPKSWWSAWATAPPRPPRRPSARTPPRSMTMTPAKTTTTVLSPSSAPSAPIRRICLKLKLFAALVVFIGCAGVAGFILLKGP